MAENRHRTVVEITADSSQAESAVRRLQGLFDKLNKSANIGTGSPSGAGPGGSVSLTPGASAPSAPATGGMGGGAASPAPLSGGGVAPPPSGGAAPPPSGGGGGPGGPGGPGEPPPGTPGGFGTGGWYGRRFFLGAAGARFGMDRVARGYSAAVGAAGILGGYARYQAAMGSPTIGRSLTAYTALGTGILTGVGAAYGGYIGAGAGTVLGGPLGGIAGAVGGTLVGSMAGSAFGSALSTVSDAVRPGLEQRLGYAPRFEQQELSMGLSRMAGIRQDRMQRAGVAMGFDPFESASMMSQFAQQRGYVGRAGGAGLFRMARAGIGVGAQAAFGGMAMPGVAWTGSVSAEGAAATAQGQGLFGSGVEKFLQRIASATEGMASRGMRVDLSEMDRFMGGVTRHFDANEGVRLGQRAPQIYERLGNAPAGLRDQLLGGFGQVGQAAIAMEAFSGSGGYFDAIRRLEGMGATGTMGAIQRNLPRELQGAVFAQMTGQPLEIGEGLSRADTTQFRRMGGRVTTPGGLALAQERARGEQKMVGDLSVRELQRLVELMGEIKLSVNSFGAIGQRLVEALEH